VSEELEKAVKRLEKYDDTTILKLLHEEDIKEIEALNKELDKFRPFTSAYEMKKEIERLNKIIEIKNNRIQQLMKRTRSARIDKATKYIDSREWENCEECMNIVYDILKGDEEE
jgi:hypothetical protein